MTTSTNDLDFELRDTTIARTVRLTQGHIDRGRLPVPPAIRAQLAPGETITVTLYFNPGFRQVGAWHTEQQGATLTGVTWPAEITPDLRADVSVQWTDGHTRRVVVVAEVLEPEPAPVRRRRRTRAAAKPIAAPVAPAVQGSEVVSREIVATAQVHGGTRVIEFAVVRHTLGQRTWSTYRVAAYDSNHRDVHDSLGTGPADTPAQIDQARADAASLLTLGSDPSYCDCWSGWDPYCGKAGCWGVVTR
jgi:hypothetical protein